jgi:hypothetical protein
MKLASDIGADRYLMKPAPTGTVLATLRDVMESKAAHPVSAAPPVEESYVLKQYSQALVNKLEEKNAELHQTLDALKRAHERILDLNSNLEQRVKERTAELEIANAALTGALSEVKELSGLLPICSYCKKVRDDKNYWESIEGYISTRTDAKFSHGVCPSCYERIVVPDLERLRASMAPKKN